MLIFVILLSINNILETFTYKHLANIGLEFVKSRDCFWQIPCQI